MPVQRTPPTSRRNSVSDIKPSNPFEAAALQNILSDQNGDSNPSGTSTLSDSQTTLTLQDTMTSLENQQPVNRGQNIAEQPAKTESNELKQAQNAALYAAKRNRDTEKEISFLKLQMNELNKSINSKIQASQSELFTQIQNLFTSQQHAAMSSTQNHTLGTRLSSVPLHTVPDQASATASLPNHVLSDTQADMPNRSSFFNDSQYVSNQKLKSNQNILSNPAKIPKFKSSEQSVMLFLNDKLLSFAEQFSVAEPEFVAQWVHLAFSEANQKKIKMIVKKIIGKTPNNLEDFFLKLAKALDPLASDTIPVKSLTRQVDSNEGLVDYVLRLQIEMRGTRYRKSEYNSKILEYAIDHEPNQTVKLEIKREFSALFGSDSISDEIILEKAAKIDQFCELGLVMNSNTKNTGINAVTKQQSSAKPADKEHRSAVCKQCGETHHEFTRAGYEYYDCRSCAIKMILEDNNLPPLRYDFSTRRPTFWNEKSQQFTPFPKAILQEVGQNYPMTSKSKTFDSRLKRRLRSPKAQNQNNKAQSNKPRTRTNSDPTSNQTHNKQHASFMNRYNSMSNVDDKDLPKLEDLTGDTNDGESWGSVSDVKGPDDILEALTDHKLNSRVKNARVVATCNIGLHEETALIDTGAFRNVISRGLVQKLGQRCNVRPSDIQKCTGFDGSVTNLDGQITLDINIGLLSYSGTFLVVPSLSNYPIILGEPFLGKNGLMTRLEKNLKELCGDHAIRRGN